jgi:hypothetical protein
LHALRARAARALVACLFLSEHRFSKARQSKDDCAVPQAVSSRLLRSRLPHLIAMCEAEPSPQPDRDCATLLVGTQSDWDLLPKGLHQCVIATQSTAPR